jgi:hypothetical protein
MIVDIDHVRIATAKLDETRDLRLDVGLLGFWLSKGVRIELGGPV